MNFKSQISNRKFQIIGIGMLLFLCLFKPAYADSAIDNGINFLKTKQDSTGKITGGFSAPSQWSAIALSANGIDVATIQNGSISLKDFLLTDIPTNASATDWESRILAIVAIGENPGNFNGINYIEKLESFAGDGQMGDICSLNDDIFGLLALIASDELANSKIKQDTLDFLIKKQDANGGFSWSPVGCSWYETSPDMTAAALQAFQAAKVHGVSHALLDDALAKVKNYIVLHQNSDGGFGAYGSEADTTGWVLMAFNEIGMQNAIEAQKAKTWLLSTQQGDGGFVSWSGTDSTTTAQAIIALSGKGWVLKTYVKSNEQGSSTPTIVVTPTPTVVSSVTPTPTPRPELISLMKETEVMVTVTPNPTTSTAKTRAILGAVTKDSGEDKISQVSPTPKPQIKHILVKDFRTKNIFLFIASGICLFLALTWWFLRLK